MSIKFICNGQEVEVSVPAQTSLLDILRNELNLQGTKKGCDEGDCGACSVIVNGRLVNACLIFAEKLQGANVLTIEGLAKNDELHPIQQAFIDAGAIQCGYCTPGMIMAAYALLHSSPQPNKLEIQRALSGNICRCTGYSKIIKAVQLAGEYMRRPNSAKVLDVPCQGVVK